MNNSVRTDINDLAQQIILKYNIAIPITNIDDVVEAIGGTVKELPYAKLRCDGQIQKCSTDSFVILISEKQPIPRRNFTIAHELGHLFIHMGYLDKNGLWEAQNSTTVYNRVGANDDEYKANEFAAAFLMPKEEFYNSLQRHKDPSGSTVNMKEVADEFHVSLSAAVNRGKFLGYLL